MTRRVRQTKDQAPTGRGQVMRPAMVVTKMAKSCHDWDERWWGLGTAKRRRRPRETDIVSGISFAPVHQRVGVGVGVGGGEWCGEGGADIWGGGDLVVECMEKMWGGDLGGWGGRMLWLQQVCECNTKNLLRRLLRGGINALTEWKLTGVSGFCRFVFGTLTNSGPSFMAASCFENSKRVGKLNQKQNCILN